MTTAKLLTRPPGQELQSRTLRRRREEVIPPGWDYNPSTWDNRVPLVLVGLAGTLIAVYLALYQYGVISTVWEPFFGDGSRKVLNSWLSHIFPISDAALGALAYAINVITGLIGGQDRWRSQPWVVILFGIFVGPLGLISVVLIIAQPVLFNAWCTLCLISAALSIVMIGPAMDEVLASLQYLKRVRKIEPQNFWKIFWGRTKE